MDKIMKVTMEPNNVTMTMDGITCVNGIPLSSEQLNNLHEHLGKCITEEIDNVILEEFRSGIKNNDLTSFMCWDADTKSYVKVT